MDKQIKRIKGTEDLFADRATQFWRVEQTARRVFDRYGFEEIRTPILELKSLFTHALGTTTDVVQKEMYEFVDRSDEAVALRPEGTAGIVRAYIENELQKTLGTVKWFYIGPMFRRERPQKGRLRQFHQIGVETIGSDSPAADAEAVLCLASILNQLGIVRSVFKLNNLGTFEERQDFKEALKSHLDPLKFKLCADCEGRLEKNVLRILDCKNPGCRAVAQQSPRIDAFVGQSRGHFETVLAMLGDSGLTTTVDPFMVRGLDYYTKTVFEVSHQDLGAQDALGAGGRYDRLVETLGGAPAPAVGFAIGLERLLLCMAQQSPKADTGTSKVFIATLGEAAQKKGFALAETIRGQGLCALMDYQARSLKSQMRSADRLRCEYTTILGDDELASCSCLLKNMKSGSQEKVPLSELTQRLKGMMSC